MWIEQENILSLIQDKKDDGKSSESGEQYIHAVYR